MWKYFIVWLGFTPAEHQINIQHSKPMDRASALATQTYLQRDTLNSDVRLDSFYLTPDRHILKKGQKLPK